MADADRIGKVGSIVSSAFKEKPIVAASLRAMGLPALPVCGTEVIRTDSSHGTAEVDPAVTTDQARRRLLDACETSLPVVTGFIGADRHGTLTTLGRGGSDLTATVLGAALDAERVEI